MIDEHHGHGQYEGWAGGREEGKAGEQGEVSDLSYEAAYHHTCGNVLKQEQANIGANHKQDHPIHSCSI